MAIQAARNFETAEQHAKFMRSDAGDKIKPGSEEERLIMEGFRASRERQRQARNGDSENPGTIASELKQIESQEGVVRTADSQTAHQRAEITAAQAQGDGAAATEALAPLEGIEPQTIDMGQVEAKSPRPENPNLN